MAEERNYVLTRPAISLGNYMNMIQEKLKEYADRDFNNQNIRNALAFDLAGTTYLFEEKNINELSLSVRDKLNDVASITLRFPKSGEPKITIKKQNCDKPRLETILDTITPLGCWAKKV